MKPHIPTASAAAVTLFALCLLTPARAIAHCDTLDGPVVTAARQAIASSNSNSVLIWVRPEDEREIKRAFEKTLRVRGLSSDAAELADT